MNKNKDVVTLVALIDKAKRAAPEDLAFKHLQIQRLLHAFAKITDPALREELVVLMEILDAKKGEELNQLQVKSQPTLNVVNSVETCSR